MDSNQLLHAVLGLCRNHRADASVEQLYAGTVTLLSTLTDPRNISILSSQFLSAPAIWQAHNDLPSCLRIVSVYNTAAIQVSRNAAAAQATPTNANTLSCDGWVKAAAKGTEVQSTHSKHFQHLLMFTGILMGMEGDERRSLSYSMRRQLEDAVVTSANHALASYTNESPVAAPAIALALTYALPLLSQVSLSVLDCDMLLPIAVRGLMLEDGFQRGTFLDAINTDINPYGLKWDWPQTSQSFAHLRAMASRPFVATAGPLSKLIVFAVNRVRNSELICQAQDEISAFTKDILVRWESNQFSAFEESDEAAMLNEATLNATWPVLWQTLKKLLFAVVASLQAIMARSLTDNYLSSDTVAPRIATVSLRILRNLCFISSRGNDNFQVYTFTYMTSLDILSRYPDVCATFLQDFMPAEAESLPAHPVRRALDLFYLNIAEHLPLQLSPDQCDILIVQPASVYLTQRDPPTPQMVQLFEAAHAAILSVLSCPDNGVVAVRVAPFYSESLLSSFPSRISVQQFRVAFKALIQILSPPFNIAAAHPDLAETLLEMVRSRISTAGKTPLPISPESALIPDPTGQNVGLMSEQSALVITLLDSLSFLQLEKVGEWMTIAATSLQEIANPALKTYAKQRFMDVLRNGELDPERAAVGVAWWGTYGGGELVLYGTGPLANQSTLMSGALPEPSPASRL